MIWDVLIPTVFLLILATGFLALSLINNSGEKQKCGEKESNYCSGCLANELINCKEQNHETDKSILTPSQSRRSFRGPKI